MCLGCRTFFDDSLPGITSCWQELCNQWGDDARLATVKYSQCVISIGMIAEAKRINEAFQKENERHLRQSLASSEH